MRILLLGNYAPDRQESMLRFAALMERELRARGHEVRLLQPRAVLGSNERTKWLGYVDKLMLFPADLRRALRDCDVIHLCDHSNAMYLRHLGGKPNVVTCHDVLAIRSALGEIRENAVGRTGQKLQRMILNGLRAAQFVVSVSHNSEREMLRVTGRPESSSAVVLTSLSFTYTPMPPGEARARLLAVGYDPARPFFLHVGGAAWYKNRMGLLKIFDRLQRHPAQRSCRLLLVGAPLEDALRYYIRRKGQAFENSITQLSGLADEDLRAAYSLAEGLIFPSLQEGFGWPILEAQACGCPIFATDREPMTEVGGIAGTYFNPSDPEAAATAIADALLHRETLCEAGLHNARRFSVANMIDGYLEAYERVLGEARTSEPPR